MDESAEAQDRPEDVGPKLSWDEIREHVERHVRRYAAASVVDLALADLWAQSDEENARLKRFPWLTLVVAKWSLLLADTLHVGDKMPAGLLAYLKQMLWEGGDQAFKERIARHEAEFPDRPYSIALMIRGPIASQKQFQTKDIWGLYRTAGLIRQLEHNHTCKRLFKERTGLAIEDFIDGCIFIYSMFSVSKSTQLSKTDFRHFEKLRGDVMPRVMALMSRSLPDLRNELKAEPPVKGNRSRELHVFSVFKRYPFIRMANGVYRCWDESVLDRYLDEAVHLAMSTYGDQYTNSFSKVFEKYVVGQIHRLGFPVMGAEEYERRYGGDVRKIKNVEGIVTHGRRRLLIEAKMSLFADDVLFQETEQGARHKLSNVLKGVVQGQTVSHRLATAHADDETHYLMVVTSRDLLVGGGVLLEDMCGPGSIDPPAGTELNLLPSTHIFVLSIDEFELLVEAVASGRVALFDLLERITDPVSGKGMSLSFTAHYRDAFGGIGGKIQMPEFIAAEHQAAMDRLHISLEAMAVKT